MRKHVSRVSRGKPPASASAGRKKKPAPRRAASKGRSQHLLEVRARGRTEARKWMRRFSVITVRWSIAIAIVVAVAWSVNWAVQKLFWDNPEFALQKIDIEVAGDIPRDQILQVSQLHEGVNLFTLDLGALERRVLAVPQVETVTIHRLPPDTVKIQVVERRPTAWLAGQIEDGDPFTDENAYLIDAGGVVLRQRASKPEHYHLPVIYGCDMDALVAGHETSQDGILDALALIATAEDLMLDTPFRVRTIDISRGYCYIVTDDQRARITFAPTNFPAQFVKLRLLYAHAVERGTPLATVNLIPERNVPVTFADHVPIEEAVVELNRDSESGDSPDSAAPTRETDTPIEPLPTPSGPARRTLDGSEEIRRAVPIKKS